MNLSKHIKEYEGDLVDNKRHGQGTTTYADGSVYQGAYENNRKHGFGIYTHFNGDKYQGQYVRNKKSGFGLYCYKDIKSTYSGYWENNKKHGYGVVKYDDEHNVESISGIFIEGCVDQGEIRFKNNAVYRGSIKSYEMDGTGILTYSDGFQIEATFFNDKLLLDDYEVCCYCCNTNCDEDCFEFYEGICSNPELFYEPDEDIEFLEGNRIRTKIIPNDSTWNISYQGTVRKVGHTWLTVKFDDGDLLMVKKDLLEKADESLTTETS